MNENLELDGNVADDAPPAPDWVNFFNADTTEKSPLPTGFTDAAFDVDFIAGTTGDNSTFTGGSKDTLDISTGWRCVGSSQVTDKGDIQNAYAAAYRDPVSNNLLVYFGVEKNSSSGDNNMGIWFLKDGTVSCENPATTGSGIPFTGSHQVGDILLVAAFSNGGTNPTIDAYKWIGGKNPLESLGSGGMCGTAAGADICAITNTGQTVTPPWPTQNKSPAGNTLGPQQFFEGGANITKLLTTNGTTDPNAECFATFLTNTRASTSPTATLYDYSAGAFATCGGLTVEKYIDTNANGVKDSGEPPGEGWSMTVTRDSNGQTVCTGITNASGVLVCSTGSLANLLSGSYTVTETQKTGFYNTDPGTVGPPYTYNLGATASKTVTVSPAGGSVALGNSCYIAKTFTVTGVPAGTTGLVANWSVTNAKRPVSPVSGSTNLTLNGATASGTQSNTFVAGDLLTWSWTFTGAGGSKTGPGETLAAGSCSATNTDAFPTSTLNGYKYKDANANGTKDAGDIDGAGFTFRLTADQDGAPTLQTAVSAANGTYSFSNVGPGTYRVYENQETGWVMTEPDPAPAINTFRTVTVPFNTPTVTIGAFGNTPLSTISVTMTPQALNPGTTTPATQAQSITCSKNATDVPDANPAQNTYSKSDLLVGTYTCTVVIIDP